MTKTSGSHPLRIDELPAGEGRLGLTFCPGKVDPHSHNGPWARDLEADLAAIRAWGATAVVTLMEGHELERLQVPRLGEAVEARGLDWYHLPIVDVDIPEADFEIRWHYAGLRLRAALRRGGKVLLHCRGGLGRTGTVAARLLVELGEEPARALARVRDARPGTVETRRQERYVLDQPPPPRGEALRNRCLAALLGGAVGDAFGYAVEFDRLEAIRRRHGPRGLREPVLDHGRLVVSDDTQMTLFTLEGILRALGRPGADMSAFVREIRRAYLDWLYTQEPETSPGRPIAGRLAFEPTLQALRAPGNTCLSALREGGWGSFDRPINESKGCGAVMRVAPVALACFGLDEDRLYELAARSAALTHGHPTGYASAGALAVILASLLAGRDLRDAVSDALTVLDNRQGQEVIAALVSALALAGGGTADPAADAARLGEGWIGEEALAIAVYAALVGRDYREVIAIAANHDGDSDSTAAIAGQLHGAWKGLAQIPHAWVRRLDVLEPMLGLAGGWLGRGGA